MTELDKIMPLFCEYNRCRRDGKKLTWSACKIKAECDSVNEAKFINEHFILRKDAIPKSKIDERINKLNKCVYSIRGECIFRELNEKIKIIECDGLHGICIHYLITTSPEIEVLKKLKDEL